MAGLLVVDDEPLVLKAVGRILSGSHELVTARSGEEALRVLNADVARHPALAPSVVFFTEGAFTASASEFPGTVPNERLDKPFAPKALRALVQRRLAT